MSLEISGETCKLEYMWPERPVIFRVKQIKDVNLVPRGRKNSVLNIVVENNLVMSSVSGENDDLQTDRVELLKALARQHSENALAQ